MGSKNAWRNRMQQRCAVAVQAQAIHIPYVFEFTGALWGKLTRIPTVLLRHALLIDASEDGPL
jgi:hypothetical protein